MQDAHIPDGLLIPTNAMPHIDGIAIPHELYWVARAPAPLAGMRCPRLGFPWVKVAQAGFKHVVRLAASCAGYDPSPLHLLRETALEDLVSSLSPSDAQRELDLIRKAAAIIAETLARGEGVVVHCMGGRGRTGTVLAAVLIQLGFPYDQVIAYLDQVHKLRGTNGWPESPWQAEVLRQFVPGPRAGDSSSAKALRK